LQGCSPADVIREEFERQMMQAQTADDLDLESFLASSE